MNRETTNIIRFAFEDLTPPILRDSWLFRSAARLIWGSHVDHLADFRRRAASLTPQEYEQLYTEHPRVHKSTDNSRACIGRIAASAIGPAILDVGCGTGYLLRAIGRGDQFTRVVGVDFVRPEGLSTDGIEFVQAPIERLPFADRSFDTVICTHVIEHILDYRAAIAELRRVAARRLIIVVPREREGIYTFNPHFNFFPYTHSFLRAMIPLPGRYDCAIIGRDIYYCEDCEPPQTGETLRMM
jgi:SAM-dependent methyltransferase